MINSLSNKCSMLLCRKDLITKQDCELYTYGFFILFSNILFTMLAILLGVVFNRVSQSLIFHISFRAIRNFAGGYHADTEMRCEVLTTLSFLAATYLISLSEKTVVQIIALVGAFLSTIVIAAFAPLDTPAKPLDADEKRKYRRISHIILSIIVSVIIISLLFNIQLLLVPCCLCLVLEAILLTAGKIKGKLIAAE